MAKISKINHIAIAVDDIEKALSFWQDGLGIMLDHIEDVECQNSRVAFLPLGDSEIELVQSTAEDTGVARFIRERGPGMHHVCVEVDDVDVMMDELRRKGIRIIGDCCQDLGDRKVAFIHPKSAFGVLVELVQKSA
jgi:methylmalonyl-CoA/ethylmalonyl-CoA epimerase